MELGSVTKIDKRNKPTSKKFNDEVMTENYAIIAIFPIYGQFGAVRKLDSGHIFCKTYITINNNLLSCKN